MSVQVLAPTKTKNKFTAETAQQFDRHSLMNAAILSNACPECQPYQDWFTYQRWQAQGFQVQKGQHGVKLLTFVECTDKDKPERTYSRPWTTTVFCRHQVMPKEES